MFTTTEFIIRIALAGVLGAAVGLERELRAKEAGTRTHFLVSMGSALFTILSQYGFDESLEVYSLLLSIPRVLRLRWLPVLVLSVRALSFFRSTW